MTLVSAGWDGKGRGAQRFQNSYVPLGRCLFSQGAGGGARIVGKPRRPPRVILAHRGRASTLPEANQTKPNQKMQTKPNQTKRYTPTKPKDMHSFVHVSHRLVRRFREGRRRDSHSPAFESTTQRTHPSPAHHHQSSTAHAPAVRRVASEFAADKKLQLHATPTLKSS